MDNNSFISSEEIQRQHATDVFEQERRQQSKRITERERYEKALDKYIAKHNSTIGVRAEAKKHERSNAYQLDLSADIVEILTKIKSDLR